MANPFFLSAVREAAQQKGAMEDIKVRTFVEVMSEKYSPDNFPYRRGPGMGVVVVPVAGPQGSPMKGGLVFLLFYLLHQKFIFVWFFLPSSSTSSTDRLNVPTMLVLSGCGISRAGEQAEIAAFCAHVMELDLSHNKLRDWHEVYSITEQCILIIYI